MRAVHNNHIYTITTTTGVVITVKAPSYRAALSVLSRQHKITDTDVRTITRVN